MLFSNILKDEKNNFHIINRLNFFKYLCTKKRNNTYYFIRHAEKIRTDNTNKNPDLSEIGKKRAEHWRTVFENVVFDKIYSTDYNRTIQTAAPTAKNKNLEVRIYNPESLYDEDFQLKTKGKTVLVVGHSNTTPQFVNKILGKEKYQEMDDAEFSQLHIITVKGNKITDLLLYSNF